MTRAEYLRVVHETLTHGVQLGMAISAGAASECPDMTGRQIAAMLDKLAMSPEAVAAVAAVARDTAIAGKPVTSAMFRDAIATMMRAAVSQRGGGTT